MTDTNIAQNLPEAFRLLDEEADTSLFRSYMRGTIPLSGRVDIFLDTETSGLATYDKVIQLAYVVKYYPGNDDDPSVIADDGLVVFKTCDIINVKCSINPHAQKVHNITQNMVRGGEDRDAVYSRLKNACNLSRKTGGSIIAFNASFDKRMMGDDFADYNWDCAMKILKEAGVKGKLSEIYKKAFGVDMMNAHNALGDVEAMIAVWEKYERHT